MFCCITDMAMAECLAVAPDTEVPDLNEPGGPVLFLLLGWAFAALMIGVATWS